MPWHGGPTMRFARAASSMADGAKETDASPLHSIPAGYRSQPSRREAKVAGGLAKTLGPFSVIGLGIGCIIGAGIFVLTGNAAAQNAGPALVLSFILGRHRLRLRRPLLRRAGLDDPGRRQRLHLRLRDLGELVAWIIGWDLILEYALGAATVAVGWSGYFGQLPRAIRHPSPAAMASTRRRGGDSSPTAHGALASSICRPPLIVLLVTGAARASASRRSARRQHRHGRDQGWRRRCIVIVRRRALRQPRELDRPSSRRTPASSAQFGWSGILRGAVGDVLRLHRLRRGLDRRQEARNPQRDMPIGILASLVICTVLYIAGGDRADRHRALPEANVADPLAVGIDATGLRWLPVWSRFAALVGLSTVIFVLLLGQTRIFYSMAGRPAAEFLQRRCTRGSGRRMCQPGADRWRRGAVAAGFADRTCSASWSASGRCSRSCWCAAACCISVRSAPRRTARSARPACHGFPCSASRSAWC